MQSHTVSSNEPHKLTGETLSKRKLPINLNQLELGLFSHELERVIPETTLLELKDVCVSPEGILFRGNQILPESFAFPANIKQWKRRSLLKFFITNNLLQRPRLIEHDLLWVTDDWSRGYFHWLTDVLSRIFVMRPRLDHMNLLLPSAFESFDFVTASLKAFEVKVEFMAQHEVVKCRRLFLPTHTAPSGHYNEEIIRGVRDLLLRTYGSNNQEKLNDCIYISRGRAPKRRIANEAVVVDTLAEFGFQTIYAEELSFEQQVKVFSRARYVVANHGAGLTNMLFMPSHASVLELRHHTDCTNNCYFTLSSALHLNYFYQTCQSSTRGQDPHVADLVVNPASLKANLDLMLGSRSSGT